MGMGLGVIFGVVRLFLKPASGVLEFTSKTLYGASDAIKAWGDEVVRVPRTRVRSPRHFGMFLADAAGGCCVTPSNTIALRPRVFAASLLALSWLAQQAGPFPAWQPCPVRRACLIVHQPHGWQPCLLKAGGPAAPCQFDSILCFVNLQLLVSAAVQQSLKKEAPRSMTAAGSSPSPMLTWPCLFPLHSACGARDLRGSESVQSRAHHWTPPTAATACNLPLSEASLCSLLPQTSTWRQLCALE